MEKKEVDVEEKKVGQEQEEKENIFEITYLSADLSYRTF